VYAAGAISVRRPCDVCLSTSKTTDYVTTTKPKWIMVFDICNVNHGSSKSSGGLKDVKFLTAMFDNF
jgi:hypothetical protein